MPVDRGLALCLGDVSSNLTSLTGYIGDYIGFLSWGLVRGIGGFRLSWIMGWFEVQVVVDYLLLLGLRL